MLSQFAQVVFGLSMLTQSFAQDRFFSEIPQEETTALSQIVEDEPIPPPAFRGGSNWISPEYKQIYGNPLPIPPVKQPKQWVFLQ